MATTKKNELANPTFDFGFESPELTKLTATIAQAEVAGAKMKLVACYALSSVKALGDELLKKNGFDTFADYARDMFGYAKSNAYNMVEVAEKFDVDESGNIHAIPELQGMGWTGLLALKSLDDNTIKKYIDEGKLTPSTSVRNVKALAAPTKQTRTRKTTKKTEPKAETKVEPKTETTPETEVTTEATPEKFERKNFLIRCAGTDLALMVEGEDEVHFDLSNSTSAAFAVQAFRGLVGC